MFSNHSGRQGMPLLFNRRRRPRQAVYASPLSQNVTMTAEVPDEQLADMAEDFDPTPKNYDFVPNHKPTARYSKIPSTRPLQTRHFSPQKHPNNQYSYGSVQPKQASNHLGARPSNNVGSFSLQQQSMSNPKHSLSTRNYFQNRLQHSTNKGFSFNNNPARQQTISGHQQFSWSNINSYSSTKGTTAENTARQPKQNERASFGGTQNQQKSLQMEKPNNEATGVSGDAFTLKSVDKSMKIVTSTIQGLRKWSEYREQLPLVFEIFATLDSVPTSNNNGLAKLFNIKDNTGMIRCIYWEMDQKLPRMARGQAYRMVGALERKSGHFQCFTIRQAQAAEQRLAPRQVLMCDGVLTKVIAMIPEA